MALGQDIERLMRVPLLSLMEPDALRLLAFAGDTRIVLAGDVLFRRGEPSEGGLLIMTGSVAMTDDIHDQGDAPDFGPGTLLGESALLRETTHGATAMARETATIFRLSRTVFLRVLEEHPVSAQRILVFLARRLHSNLLDDREHLEARG